MKQILLLSIFMFLSFALISQDPHFTQRPMHSLYLNPGSGGQFEGQMQATLIYRDQWYALGDDLSFRTFAFEGEYKYMLNTHDFWNIGIRALQDKSGIANYRQTQFHISGNYSRKLSGDTYGRKPEHILSAGFQIGLGQNAIDGSQLWFGRQYDVSTLTIDVSLPSGEPLNTSGNLSSRIFLDANAGIFWTVNLPRFNSFSAGIAVHHLNTPGISLLNSGNDKLSQKYVVHAGGDLRITRHLYQNPHILYIRQGPSFEILLGDFFEYKLKDTDDLAFGLGLQSRIVNSVDGLNWDAVMLSTSFRKSNWRLGLSYDMSTAAIKRANNGIGAFEIVVNYIFDKAF